MAPFIGGAGEGGGGGGAGGAVGAGGGLGGSGERACTAGGGEGGGRGTGGGRGLRVRTVVPEKERARPARSPTSPRGTSAHTSHTAKPSTTSKIRFLHPCLGRQKASRLSAACSFAARSSALLCTGAATGTGVALVGTGRRSYALRPRPTRLGTNERNVKSMPLVSMLSA